MIRRLLNIVSGDGIEKTLRHRRLPIFSFGKWAQAIFLDRRAVLSVELGSVAELFVHQGISVIDMLGAEDVTEFVNQGDLVKLQFSVRTAVVKNPGNRHDYIIRQSFRAIADTIDARPARSQDSANALGCEKHDQIVAIVLSGDSPF